jgi:CHC2 zinc finger
MTAEQLAADARSVLIEDEVTRRGIRLQGRGTDRAGPCPVCGGTDRFGVNIKKQMFYCRKCDVGGDVITFVRHVDGCTFKEAVNLLTGGHTPPQKSATGARHGAAGHRDSGGPAKAADNAAKAAWLWSRREPISESCPAGLYLRRTRRYHGPIPSTLAYLPPNSKYPPAMIAAFGFCEEIEPGVIDPPAFVTGIHLTRLTPEGEKIAGDKPKIMLGPSAGLPVVLAPANDLLAIDITEGLETGLSVLEWRGAGVWVAGSAGRCLRSWKICRHTRNACIFLLNATRPECALRARPHGAPPHVE